MHIKYYDVFKSIYEKFVNQSITLNSGTSMVFSLNDDKWLTMLRTLSNFRLPEINYYQLDYIPADSEDVKTFMKNSISAQKKFWFNYKKQVQVEGSKYFEALKSVARITADNYYVYYTNFSAHEFCGLISAAKSVKNLHFFYDLIPLDYECDFGTDMEECKIEQIQFVYSGGSSYSNWGQNPMRFENLIAAISKCEPLTKSLKTLYFGYCDVTKAKAQEMLNKYKLTGIQVTV